MKQILSYIHGHNGDNLKCQYCFNFVFNKITFIASVIYINNVWSHFRPYEV